ncbi:MAG: 3'-5' exonuclease domain-containing protein 2 [Bacteroidales bacterium]|nr:3'-5' exonuclease domain-containing protein 2 [Bacteroidales bacterium]
MNFASHIDPDELNLLPLRSFQGTIHVVSNTSEAEDAVRRLSQAEILGFDTETKPTFKKGKLNPVSLLQLATRNDAYLFRMNKLGRYPALEPLLTLDRPLKIGAAIHEDIRALKALYPKQTDGFIDLQDMVGQYGIENIGVKKMAAIVLGFRISKSQQLSNWEADTLTEAQMVYAATDAWVSLEIYLKLIQNGTP